MMGLPAMASNRDAGERASASLSALAVSLLIAAVAIGALRISAAAAEVVHRSQLGADPVTELAIVARRAAAALSDRPSVNVQSLSADLSAGMHGTATIRPADALGVAAGKGLRRNSIPANPVVADRAFIEQVYTGRVGSEASARRFSRVIARRIESGAPISESDIRDVAGLEYPLIMGIITGEPVLNVNAAPPELLGEVTRLVESTEAETARRLVAALLDERSRREISDAELGAAIDTAVSTAGPDSRLLQDLSAYLGTRTWVWDIEVVEEEWRGSATLVLLPGSEETRVIGMSIGSR